ncbi:MAG: hypothetical protein RLZZ28_1963 [Bacteroidota bacterium]
MKKNILITGASGFIGSYLVEEALHRNYHTVAGIRRSSSKQYLRQPGLGFLEMDFESDALLNESIRSFTERFGKIDYVIHNAGITRAKDNQHYETVNAGNTERLVNALIRNKQVPEKFVLISSLAAFGPSETDEPVGAHQVPRPLTGYGKSKLIAEKILYNTKGFPFVIINPTAVYGPRDKDVFFLMKSIQNHFEVYIGSSHQLLSFVHVQDLCRAIFLAMESDAVRKNFLISDLQVYTSKEFNRLVKKELGVKTISLVLPGGVVKTVAIFAEAIGKITGKIPIINRERLKEFEARNWAVNAGEIKNLGFEPQYGLEAGLKHSIQWYKEQGWLK